VAAVQAASAAAVHEGRVHRFDMMRAVLSVAAEQLVRFCVSAAEALLLVARAAVPVVAAVVVAPAPVAGVGALVVAAVEGSRMDCGTERLTLNGAMRGAAAAADEGIADAGRVCPGCR
jgi:hypothetical protein